MNELTNPADSGGELLARRSPAYEAIRADLYDVCPEAVLPPLALIHDATEQLRDLAGAAPRGAIIALIGRLVAGFPSWQVTEGYVGTLTAELLRFPADIALVGLDEMRLKPSDFPPTISRVVEHCRELYDERFGIPLRQLERAESELHRRLGQANDLLARCDEFEREIDAVLAGTTKRMRRFDEFARFAAEVGPREACTWPQQLWSGEPWIAAYARWLVIGFRLNVAAMLKPGSLSEDQAKTVLGLKGDATAARSALREIEAKTFTASSSRWLTPETLDRVLPRLMRELWDAGREARDELTDEERIEQHFRDEPR